MLGRPVLVAVLAIVIGGLVGLMAWGLTNKVPVTALSGSTRLQQLAPPFKLMLLDGGQLERLATSTRPMVINFWASWCAPCRDEADDLERVWRSFADEGVMFVGVNIQDSVESAREHVREFGLTYPNGRDSEGVITVDYGVIGIPVTFFVNKFGIVERRWVGELDESLLQTWVGEMLAGVTPSEGSDGQNLESFQTLFRQR